MSWITLILVLPILVKLFYTYFDVIKYFLFFFLYYFLSSVIAVALTPVFLLRIGDCRNCTLGARYLKYVTKVYNLKWIPRNEHVLAKDGGAVIVSNHQSAFDILGMFNVWEVAAKMTAVSKKELIYVFPFGTICYLVGVIFIDKKNPKKAFDSLMRTTEAMTKNEIKIWLFPEGTRNTNRSKLLPFKKGAFNMAVAAQVPIIPVVYSPYYFINDKKFIFERGGEIIMKFLDPVPTTGLKEEDIPKLIEKVYGVMDSEYQDLLKEIKSKQRFV